MEGLYFFWYTSPLFTRLGAHPSGRNDTDDDCAKPPVKSSEAICLDNVTSDLSSSTDARGRPFYCLLSGLYHRQREEYCGQPLQQGDALVRTSSMTSLMIPSFAKFRCNSVCTSLAAL